MKTLVLDSHQLSTFQRCPRLFWYQHQLNLERRPSAEDGRGLYKGTIIHEVMERINLELKAGTVSGAREVSLLGMDALKSSLAANDAPSEWYQPILEALCDYWNLFPPQNLDVLAVEKGFSKVLYEDSDHLFIYEGKIDLVFRTTGEPTPAWLDYKSQSQKYNIYAKGRSQFLGYSWALEYSKGYVDYIGLQAGKIKDKHRRQPIIFSKQEIDQWLKETIGWFFRIRTQLDAQDKGLMNYHSCQDKYGICRFHSLCELPNSKLRDWVQQRDFKERDDPWNAWVLE